MAKEGGPFVKKDGSDGLEPAGTVRKYKGSVTCCRCCGMIGKHISGCNCNGGASHQCQRKKEDRLGPDAFAALRLEKDVAASKRNFCTCCGMSGKTAQGCSCRGGRSHSCLRLQNREGTAPLRGEPILYKNEVVNKIQITPSIAPDDASTAPGLGYGSSKDSTSTMGPSKPTFVVNRQAASSKGTKVTTVKEELSAEVKTEMHLLRWAKMIKKIMKHNDMALESWTDVAPDEDPGGKKLRKRGLGR